MASLDFVIEGGRPLSGEVVTNSSKNGAMGLLSASLLNRGRTLLHGIPRIEEVNRFLEIFAELGVATRWTGPNSLEILPPAELHPEGLVHPSVSRVRSCLMLIGSLIHRAPGFSMAHSGGCKMGERTIAAHRYGLERLGVSIASKDLRYDISARRLRPAEIVMYEASDTAAENLLIAAAGIEGTTTIKFAPANYQVQEVGFFLERLGAQVDGLGTTTMTVRGAGRVERDVEHANSEDPVEAMMFVSVALTTGSTLTIRRVPIDFLELELLKLEVMGARITRSAPYLAANGRTRLVDLVVKPSKLKVLPDKIHALPYPGINSDNLPFFVPIATQAKGTMLIHDWMWENRAIYFTELNRLGANIQLADPHRVFVTGPTPLKAAEVVCPPALRPAMIVLIGMLAAPGRSLLHSVYSINRGYEEIAERLNRIGAAIRVSEVE